MSHYQMSVKAQLSLKQITANHKLYFWPSLKCSLILISLSHYLFIFHCLYSPPSVCTDKMVFHTHLTDTDLVIVKYKHG